MDKKRLVFNQTQKDQQQPGSSSTQKSDPLLEMLNGPMELEELQELASTMPPNEPDVPESEKAQMFDRLQTREGFLVPDWWRGSVEEFHQELNWRITHQLTMSGESEVARQSATLSCLLSMWQEHLLDRTM
jgi:hypothetical protein